MIIPFVSDELFEINNNSNITFDSINSVIYLDNIFNNYNDILDIIYNVSVESWKKSPTSRNFIDYYDCRLDFNNINTYKKDNSFLYEVMNYYFRLNNKQLYFQDSYSFNYFKNKCSDLDSRYQFFPHYDMAFNIIFYIDEISDGGTALYENVDNWVNLEHHNIFYDITKLKLKSIVKAKPNRAAIFYGNQLHGGYINNHNSYYHNWRINMTNFVKEEL